MLLERTLRNSKNWQLFYFNAFLLSKYIRTIRFALGEGGGGVDKRGLKLVRNGMILE
mgnify:CR=1 FL=1